MILADTSVWITHIRQGVPALAGRLEQGTIHCHGFVLGELACGTMKRRQEILEYLARLPMLPIASPKEALDFLDSRRLWGRGLGWVDVHLLASAVLAGARLWTLDRRLADAARSVHVGAD